MYEIIFEPKVNQYTTLWGFSSPFRNPQKLSVTFNVALKLNRIPFVIYSKEKSYTKNKLIKFNEIVALLSATNSFSWCLNGIQTKTNKTKNKNTQTIMGKVSSLVNIVFTWRHHQ